MVLRVFLAALCVLAGISALHAQQPTTRNAKAEEAKRLIDSGNALDQNRGAAMADTLCSAGNADACEVLSSAYFEGRGVRRDQKKAFEVTLMACELGSARACGYAGTNYELGQGTSVNHELGLKYSRRGCDLGDPSACSNLGVYLLRGRIVTKDVAKAIELFTGACRAGGRMGCANLAEAYDEGDNITRDLPLAQELYDLACDKGHVPSCERGEALARRNKFARFPNRFSMPDNAVLLGASANEARGLTHLYVARTDNLEAREVISDILKRKVPSLPFEAENAPINPTTGYVIFALRGRLYVGEFVRVIGKEKRVMLTERYTQGRVVDLARQFAGEVVRFIQNPPSEFAVLPMRFTTADELRAANTSKSPAPASPASAPPAPAQRRELDATATKIVTWLGANTTVKTDPADSE